MNAVRIVLGLAILLFFQAEGIAQKTKTIKVYGNFALNNGVTIPVFEAQNNRVISFRWPSFAIKYQYENNRYTEWEMTNLVFQKAPDSETDTRFSIGLRFEHGTRMTKSTKAPLTISAGGSIRTYFGLEQLNETNILGLATENKFYGLSLAFTPHFEYRLTKKLTFDFSPYIELANGSARLEYVYDEFIDEDQRGSVDFYFRGFQTMLRVGLGWRFSE